MHQPISITRISLAFANHCCFEDFSSIIYPADRIAIIGRNGSGKSTLLKLLSQQLTPSEGEIHFPQSLITAYVPQTINNTQQLSGGQRFNQALSMALAQTPDVLLLDEPTNHLDNANRKSLIRMLQHYTGTLLIATHDITLLKRCIDKLWHIQDHKIYQFTGHYEDYLKKIKQHHDATIKKSSQLKQDKKSLHEQLMQEQHRAAKSKAKGKKNIDKRKWPTITSKAKALRAEKTTGKKKIALNNKKQIITDELSSIKIMNPIVPHFSLAAGHSSHHNIITISHASLAYEKSDILLTNIHLSLSAKECIAICGKNASGKSTLLKAILGKDKIIKTGTWNIPNAQSIGYVDQHYATLDPSLSVFDHIQKTQPHWDNITIRKHLNDFLFRKNPEVFKSAAELSGGEKARLSLSIIAAKTPQLLILDEITNNLDLETKIHVTQILKHYPGAMIVVSHEEDFLNSINIDHCYYIENKTLI